MASGILISTLQDLLAATGTVLLLRTYLKAVAVQGDNVISRVIGLLTEWAIKPVSAFLPNWRSIELAFLTPAFAAALLSGFVSASHGFSFGAFCDAFVLLLFWALRLSLWCVLLQCLLSWISDIVGVMDWPNPLKPILEAFQALTDPILNPLRKKVFRDFVCVDPAVFCFVLPVWIALYLLSQY